MLFNRYIFYNIAHLVINNYRKLIKLYNFNKNSQIHIHNIYNYTYLLDLLKESTLYIMKRDVIPINN